MSVAQSLKSPQTSAVNTDAAPTRPTIEGTERLARLQLARSLNVGPRTYGHLLRRFGTAQRALNALPELAARGGKSGYEACTKEKAEAELAAGKRAGAELMVLGDEDYPPLLAAIDPPPPVIWWMGNPELLSRPAVAIVGARNASALGLRTARRLARELGATGHVIVSGLARGIDAAAHEASLPTGTIAVLAGGLDHPYPPENVELFERVKENGVVVSEMPFGVAPTSKHFPRRNRLISGLARGVVLVEAAARSGSLITARFALEQGREAMACPGAPDDPRSGGCNQLIREGAALIRHAGDIEEALAVPRGYAMAEEGRGFEFDADMFGEDQMRDDYDALADFDEEGGIGDEALSEQIMGMLSPRPTEIDEIARQCGTTASELSLAILELDLAGKIEIQPGGTISLKEDDD